MQKTAHMVTLAIPQAHASVFTSRCIYADKSARKPNSFYLMNPLKFELIQ